MSDLVQKIQKDLMTAMKEKDELKLSVLRMLKSAIQLVQTEKSKDAQLSDEDVFAIIRRSIKQRKEAAELYTKGGAADRAQSELNEAKVLETYLPAQLSDEDIAKIVADVAKQLGATGPRDMGKIMGKVMGAAKGQADGNKVKEAVQKYLASL